MDRFELRMHECALDNDWMMRSLRVLAPLMQEFLEIIQRVVHFRNRRRNECRVRKTGSLRADPILRNTKVAGSSSVSAETVHEFSVDFPNQPKTKWELGKAPDTMIQRADVIDDFSSVVKSLSFRRLLPFFKSNDLIEC